MPDTIKVVLCMVGGILYLYFCVCVVSHVWHKSKFRWDARFMQWQSKFLNRGNKQKPQGEE